MLLLRVPLNKSGKSRGEGGGCPLEKMAGLCEPEGLGLGLLLSLLPSPFVIFARSSNTHHACYAV